MADRYRVGGTGNWTDTAKWSASSGGAGGASVPTFSDNAIIDANSGLNGTLTFDGTPQCLTFDMTAANGTWTLAGSATLEMRGHFRLKAGTTRTWAGTIVFSATSGSWDIHPNGVTMGNALGIQGNGGTWTLQSDWIATTGNACNMTAGTFNTNGFALTCGNLALTGTTPRTLNLGASALNVVSFTTSGSNLTLNAGTSTITNTPCNWTSLGHTFYNVVIGAPAQTAYTFSGADTFNNLTITATAATSNTILTTGNKVINGTLKLLGNSVINRTQIGSAVATEGIQKTWTVAVIDGTSDFVYFQDTVIAGAAAPFAVGTSIGDAGNNSGITSFTAPVTRYWAVFGANGNWASTSSWAATLGGAPGASVPLCHDDVVIEGNFTGAARQISVNQRFVAKNITFGNVTGTGCIFNCNGGQIFGNLDFGNSLLVTVAGTQIIMCGRATNTLTAPLSGFFPTGIVTVAMGGNTLELGRAVTAQRIMPNAASFQITSGTLKTNNYDVTVASCRSDGATAPAKIWDLGASVITLFSNGNSWAVQGTNCTVIAGTSILHIDNTVLPAQAQNLAFSQSVTPQAYNIIRFSGKLVLVTGSAFSANEVQIDAGVQIEWTAISICTAALWTCNGSLTPSLKVGSLNGQSTAAFTTPDSVANSVTGDLDIRWKMAPANLYGTALGAVQVPFSKRSGSTISWEVIYSGTTFQFNWMDAAFNNRVVTFDAIGAAPAFTWREFRITLDVDNGAGGHVAKLEENLAGVWTQVGVIKNAGAFTTNVRNTSEVVCVGADSNGTGSLFPGLIEYAELRNGIGGPVVCGFYPTDYVSGATWVSSSPSAETWTFGQRALIREVDQVGMHATATRATLTKSGGGAAVFDGAVIRNIDANPASTFWYGRNTVDGGNNLDWSTGVASPATAPFTLDIALAAPAEMVAEGSAAFNFSFTDSAVGFGVFNAAAQFALDFVDAFEGEAAYNFHDAEAAFNLDLEFHPGYFAKPKRNILKIPAKPDRLVVPEWTL
jgi:hypothetical protein